MNKKIFPVQLLISITIPVFLILLTILGNQVITVWGENAPLPDRTTVIIDAGHGGTDGGAISCTGCPESFINLDIALRLDDLMHLIGIQTVMIRTEDCSIEIQGTTIAQKKLSDLKQRVKLVNESQNSILISIHQNYFSDGRYSGAQVFYASTDGSKDLATHLQAAFVSNLNPGSKRSAKSCTGVYLMDRINTVGILAECGFLSNPEEESKLRSDEYQKQICCVIASVTSRFIETRQSLDLS